MGTPLILLSTLGVAAGYLGTAVAATLLFACGASGVGGLATGCSGRRSKPPCISSSTTRSVPGGGGGAGSGMSASAIVKARVRAITGSVFLRAMPEVGRSVLIVYPATSVRGTVRRVEDDGRRLLVSTEDGETVGFALNRATATFTAEGNQAGARLWFGAGAGSPD